MSVSDHSMATYFFLIFGEFTKHYLTVWGKSVTSVWLCLFGAVTLKGIFCLNSWAVLLKMLPYQRINLIVGSIRWVNSTD